MKTAYFSLLLLLISFSAAHAQYSCTHFYLTHHTAEQGDTINVDLRTSGFADIVSLQYSINYNSDILHFLGSEDHSLTGLWYSNIGNPSAGNLVISWVADDVVSGQSLENGALICRFKFAVLSDPPAPTPIEFSAYPMTVEVTNSNNWGGGGFIAPIFHAGSVSQTLNPSPIFLYRGCDTLSTCQQIMSASWAHANYQVVGGIPPYSFMWSKDGFWFSDEENPVLEEPGHYSVLVADALGVFSTAELDVVEELFYPKVDFVLCSMSGQESGVISLDLSNGMPPYDIQWSNGLSANEISDLAPGLYSVTVTDQSLCSGQILDIEVCEMPPFSGEKPADSSVPDQFDIEGITEDGPYLSLWPNPASDIIYIQSEADILSYSLRDKWGKEVCGSSPSLPDQRYIQLDLRHLQAGQYFMVLKTELGIKQKMLILMD
ncbi:MAG: hypothetical protein GYB31_16985 [Bacteroidetes bacterium]|nr:hypothetical protein [Bacteroidota bacterium]